MHTTLNKGLYRSLRQNLVFEPRFWPTGLIMATDVVLLTVAFWLATRTGWAPYLLAQPLFVLVFFHNFAVLHEAGHGNLSRRESVNTFAGYYASIFCCLPYFPWKYIHAEHHSWAGNVERDPTLKLVRDYEQSQHVKNALLRFAWRSWVPLLALGQHIVFWTYPLTLLAAGKLHGGRLTRAIVSVLLLGCTYAALYLMFPAVFSLLIFGPALVVYLIVVELVNFPHHIGTALFDSTEHDDKLPLWRQAEVTRSCYYPPVLADVLLMNFNFHIEHHLFPDLPWFRLAKARTLTKDVLGHEYRESTGIAWNLENRVKPMEDVFLRDADGVAMHNELVDSQEVENEVSGSPKVGSK